MLGNQESENIFFLKTFRHKSCAVKIFCSDAHLINFFDILQVCYNKIVLT